MFFVYVLQSESTKHFYTGSGSGRTILLAMFFVYVLLIEFLQII